MEKYKYRVVRKKKVDLVGAGQLLIHEYFIVQVAYLSHLFSDLTWIDVCNVLDGKNVGTIELNTIEEAKALISTYKLFVQHSNETEVVYEDK